MIKAKRKKKRQRTPNEVCTNKCPRGDT